MRSSISEFPLRRKSLSWSDDGTCNASSQPRESLDSAYHQTSAVTVPKTDTKTQIGPHFEPNSMGLHEDLYPANNTNDGPREGEEPPFIAINAPTSSLASFKADLGEPETTSGGDVTDSKIEPSTIYKRRFWILGLFSYGAFIVMLLWGTFGPILKSAEFAFQWGDWYISLLEGWGTLSSFVFLAPFNWATQKYGLRFGVILLFSILTLGSGLRCFSLNDKVFTVLASLGAIASGMGACLTFSLPAMVSSTWFPPNERATATAIGSLSSQLACAAMYLPAFFVRTKEENPSLNRDDVKEDIQILMLVHFGMSALGLVCVLAYFPSRPPSEPSTSSSLKRINYLDGVKMIARDPQVIIVVLSYVISMAIPLSWLTVINFSLSCLGISQRDAMWIVIASCVISPLLAFIIARVTDRFYGHLKITIIGLLCGSFCFFVWFLLLTEGVIPPKKYQIFVAVVGAVAFQYSSVPLLIELAVELAYPCPEGVVGGVLAFMMDITDTIFFLLLMIPSECYRWVSFVLLGCTSIPVIMMVFVKEVHKRSDCAINQSKQPPLFS